MAGLSRKSAQQFVGKIQPLLLRKCATARCHTVRAKNRFRLKRIHAGRGSHRASAEQNLATVFKFVDFNKPVQSPLLVVPLEKHGNGRKAIFHGLAGTKQLTVLRQWIEQVALERNLLERPKLARSPFEFSEGSRRIQQVSAVDGNVRQRRPNDKSKFTRTPIRNKDEELLQTILREEQKDAFDPDVFNRRVHGPKGRRPASGVSQK